MDGTKPLWSNHNEYSADADASTLRYAIVEIKNSSQFTHLAAYVLASYVLGLASYY